jgi:multicomponent Na+:H+ antiporter subunit G
MSAFIAVLSTGLIAAGVLFFVAGTVGLLRFPDPASRLHALTKADNLGLGLVVAGLLPYAEGPLAAATLIVIWLLVLLASATAGQLLLLCALDDADEERRP